MIVDDVLALVAAERRRQDMRWGRPAERGLSPETWLAILGEEVGEVCRAYMRVPPLQDDGTHGLRTELTHVAAVCGAWAEADGCNMPVFWTKVHDHWSRRAITLHTLLGLVGLVTAAGERSGLARELRNVAGIAVRWAASLDGEAK